MTRVKTTSGLHSVSALCDNGAGSSRLVLPGRGEDTDGLVVAGQTVDSGLDENEAELGVLVLAVALKVLADGDSLLVSILLVLTLHNHGGKELCSPS